MQIFSRPLFFCATAAVCLAGIAGPSWGTTANFVVTDTEARVPPPDSPVTVSADGLPTWQINGVVWSQVVVNNIVYATGSFTKARPPGVAAGGPGEVDAQNIFAYDITTGQRVSTFNHSLNAQGLAIAASPDGSRVYVGGDFTAVDGIARGHVASFRTASGALDLNFAPKVQGQVTSTGRGQHQGLRRRSLRHGQRPEPAKPCSG